MQIVSLEFLDLQTPKSSETVENSFPDFQKPEISFPTVSFPGISFVKSKTLGMSDSVDKLR